MTLRMTPDAFTALCKLARLRPASQSTLAARLVLVDGMTAAAAARQMGVPGQIVHDAASHARKAAALAVAAAAGVFV